MKKLHTKIIMAFLAIIATVYAGVTIDLTVYSQGDNASLVWNVSGMTLSDQERFSVQRKSAQTDFVEIASITATGSTFQYQYTDKAAFKATDAVYTYRIRLVDVNNPNYVYGTSPETRTYLNISGVKKTWGSIKAMFR